MKTAKESKKWSQLPIKEVQCQQAWEHPVQKKDINQEMHRAQEENTGESEFAREGNFIMNEKVIRKEQVKR